MNQNELNYLIDALANKNEELIKDIIESDTFKKKAIAAEQERAKETKKTKKEKSE
jgi:hypothetical protein